MSKRVIEKSNRIVLTALDEFVGYNKLFIIHEMLISKLPIHARINGINKMIYPKKAKSNKRKASTIKGAIPISSEKNHHSLLVR